MESLALGNLSLPPTGISSPTPTTESQEGSGSYPAVGQPAAAPPSAPQTPVNTGAPRHITVEKGVMHRKQGRAPLPGSGPAHTPLLGFPPGCACALHA
jgi:hypothetical protein